jgi:cytochrome P450
MPFGAGPRICIGSAFATMEAVAILAVLLQALRLRGTSDAAPAPTMKVTLRPRREILMRIEPRMAPALREPSLG